MTKTTIPTLTRMHLLTLLRVQSAISVAVITTRIYRTFVDPADLLAVGFGQRLENCHCEK